MDLNKLNFINKEEKSSATPKRKSVSRPKKNAMHTHRTVSRKTSSNASDNVDKTPFTSIRIRQGVADKLHALQQITGDRSRTALIENMIHIVDPVILNSERKKRQYHHDLRLIGKKHQILAELNKKM